MAAYLQLMREKLGALLGAEEAVGHETRINETKESRCGVSLMPSERTLLTHPHSHMLRKGTLPDITLDARPEVSGLGEEGSATRGKWTVPPRTGSGAHCEIHG